MYKTVPINQIKTQSGPTPVINYNELIAELIRAYDSDAGVIVPLPKNYDKDNFRGLLKNGVGRRVGYRGAFGMTYDADSESFYVWLKRKLS